MDRAGRAWLWPPDDIQAATRDTLGNVRLQLFGLAGDSQHRHGGITPAGADQRCPAIGWRRRRHDAEQQRATVRGRQKVRRPPEDAREIAHIPIPQIAPTFAPRVSRLLPKSSKRTSRSNNINQLVANSRCIGTIASHICYSLRFVTLIPSAISQSASVISLSGRGSAGVTLNVKPNRHQAGHDLYVSGRISLTHGNDRCSPVSPPVGIERREKVFGLELVRI